MHVIGVDSKNLFQAMADFTRIRILRLLVTTLEEICLCELVDSLDEPQYNLSKHLKILRQAGILTATKEGRWVYHGLVTKTPHIENLYELIRALPDPNKTFAFDLRRFANRKPLRDGGRCRTDIQSAKGAARKTRR